MEAMAAAAAESAVMLQPTGLKDGLHAKYQDKRALSKARARGGRAAKGFTRAGVLPFESLRKLIRRGCV